MKNIVIASLLFPQMVMATIIECSVSASKNGDVTTEYGQLNTDGENQLWMGESKGFIYKFKLEPANSRWTSSKLSAEISTTSPGNKVLETWSIVGKDFSYIFPWNTIFHPSDQKTQLSFTCYSLR